jgi:signal transduction histidine kinase
MSLDPPLRAEAALLQAQRLEATGMLAGGIAHDFNNILAAILGFGEMALRDARQGSRQRRDIENIMTAAERGRSLVERMLAFSKTGIVARVPVQVEGVVREAVEMLSATLPASVQIDTRLNAGQAAMLGDSTQVHQVFMNLATNAVQAMPAGGTLRVSLDVIALDSARMHTMHRLEAGQYIQLVVADEGVGIPTGILDRIFDPFFTTKDMGGGTGLGLSIVQGIVNDVGGAIEVASSSAGSTFTIYLPRTGDAERERGGPAMLLKQHEDDIDEASERHGRQQTRQDEKPCPHVFMVRFDELPEFHFSSPAKT